MHDISIDTKLNLYDHLCKFILADRKKRIEDVVRNRTRHLTLVLEDIFQPHNASAVLRTCDCFGIQDVHIIENKNEYHINPDVALGSSNWLSLFKYNQNEENTLSCIETLKKKGYTIAATSLHSNYIPMEDLDIHKKTAIFFGTEKSGLSTDALENADIHIHIPMVGFTESFNISVSAAIILHTLTNKIRKSNIDWMLSEPELLDIKLDWVKQTIKKSDLIIEQFLQNYSKKTPLDKTF